MISLRAHRTVVEMASVSVLSTILATRSAPTVDLSQLDAGALVMSRSPDRSQLAAKTWQRRPAKGHDQQPRRALSPAGLLSPLATTNERVVS